MYGVMIIDDDAKIRSRLKTMIDWEHLPIEFVCEAADSDTARDLYLVYRPKIIITDIFIPIITGLELAEELSRIDPELRFIIITGYDDFAHAKQAVKLGAVDLLSKPLFSETINESLKKAVQYFEKLQKDRSSITALQDLLQNNLHDIQDSYVGNLLHGKPKQPRQIEAKLRNLHISIPGPRYMAALVTVGDEENTEDFEALSVLLKKTICTTLNSRGLEIFSYMDSQFRVACVVSLDNESDDDVEVSFNLVCDEMSLSTGCRTKAGLGGIVNDPAQLYLSYNEAVSALTYLNTVKSDSVILYRNITNLLDPFPTRGEVLDYIIQVVRQSCPGSPEDLEKAIRNYIRSIFMEQHDEEAASAQVKSFLLEILLAVSAEVYRFGMDLTKIESFENISKKLFLSRSQNEQIDFIMYYICTYIEMRENRTLENNNHLISLAKVYITDHLHEGDLNLEKVSDAVGLSKIYFCKLFHKEEGISFTNYLKRERVKKAKELLLTSNLKIYEVSLAVGFTNAKYFGYIFKQETGFTPGDFQKTRSVC